MGDCKYGSVLVKASPWIYMKIEADILYSWRGLGEGMSYELLLFRFPLNMDTLRNLVHKL